MTGDQNLWRKSYAYEPSARIPMIVRWPQGLVSAKRGQVLNQAVEIRDVLPTFLDAAGVQEQKAGFDGRSLLSLIRNPKSEWREWIDLEHDICYGPDNHWSALTDGRTKYIFHARDGEEQLFDLTSDPAEMNDLAQDTSHSQSLRLWRQKLIDYLSERGDRFVKGGKLALRPESYLYSPNYPACSCHPRQRSA
jgi:arylsulfatase